MEKDTRKIAIYSRKSKFTGKGDSTSIQIEACKKAINMKYDDIDIKKDIIIYEDEGYSGANTKRPAFQNMLKAIQNNEIKAIVFYKLDRISRNVSDFSSLLEELTDYNVSLISVTENIDTESPMGKAMIYITSVFAQLERDTIAERITDNMIALSKTGRWLGGATPTGFKSEAVEYVKDNDDKKRKLFKLSPVEDEVRVIKLIFSKMFELRSQTKLETFLINNDIKTKNNKNYTRWTLKNILTNPVYAIADMHTYNYFKNFKIDIHADIDRFNGKNGLMVYNKTGTGKSSTGKPVIVDKDITEWIVSVGKHKGIISGKDWVEVQNIIKGNTSKRYRHASVTNALLSGIIRCSFCGSFMRAKTSPGYDELGRRKFNYMCELKEKSRRVKCNCPNVNGRVIDDLVMEEIKKVSLPTSKLYLKLKDISTSIFDKETKINEELKTLRKAINKNESSIEGYIEKIPYIEISEMDEINNKIKKLKETNKNLEKQIKEITKRDHTEIKDKDMADLILNILDTYLNSFDDLNLKVKRTMIKAILPSVTTDGESLVINFIGTRDIDNTALPVRDDFKQNTHSLKSI
ncbi:MAG: recombinase family protein [Bacilli bacterium]|jgi:site-specific DNA recombinase